jgi:DNA-binding transcriptional MocR family regulator
VARTPPSRAFPVHPRWDRCHELRRFPLARGQRHEGVADPAHGRRRRASARSDLLCARDIPIRPLSLGQFRTITGELLSGSDGNVLQYGPTRGYRPLVEALDAILSARGIASAFDERLITTGSQQGLDLLARVLIDPGDVILVELPTYTGAIAAFRNAQADLVGVPQDADGINLEALDATWSR